MKRILIIASILGMLSCEKENTEDLKEVVKPVRIIQISEEQQDTSNIHYNGSNLSRIENKNGKTVFEYQSAKLIKQSFFRIGDDLPWLFLTHEYNNQKQLIKTTYNINVNSTAEDWIGEKIDSYEPSAYYAYEYIDEFTVNEYYYDYQSKDTTSYYLTKLDANKNISERIQYSYYSEIDTLAILRKSMFEYDNKSHYLKNVNYPAIDSYSNNLISETKVGYSSFLDSDGNFRNTESTTNSVYFTNEYNNLDYIISSKSNDYEIKIEYME